MGQKIQQATTLDLDSVLGYGREAARTSTEICRVYGVNRRSFERQIQEARLKGVPIAAAMDEPMGYYRPNTPDEMAGYIRTLDSRINELQKVRDASATSLLDDLKKGI